MLSVSDLDPSKIVLPRSVSIVCFGAETTPWAKKKLVEDGYVSSEQKIFDLRKRLSDPLGSDRVRHGEDGTSEKTQLAVMQQSAFAGVAQDIVGQVFELLAEDADHLLIGIHCRTGFHRAWVAADVSCIITNSFYNGADGQKLFEAQVFHFASCTSKGDAMSQLQHAWDWAGSETAPWTHMPIPNQIFGKSGASRSRAASSTVETLEAFIGDVQQWWGSQIAPGLPASSPESSPVPSPSPDSLDDDRELPSQSPPHKPTMKQPATIVGDITRLHAKRVEKNKEAPHVMNAISDHD